MQSSTCFKWVHIRCLLLFYKFKTLGSCLLELSSLMRPRFFWFTLINTVSSSSGFSNLFDLVHLAPLCQCSAPAPPLSLNLLPFFCLLRIFSLHSFDPLMFLGVFLYLLLPPLTCSGFFNGMPEVFELGAQNYCSLSHLILWILFVFRNSTFTRLPVCRFLNSLLCDLIAFTPGLTLFLLMTPPR